MKETLVNHPAKCWNTDRLSCFGRDCRACYFEQMRDGSWVGDRRCLEAGCLAPAEDE